MGQLDKDKPKNQISHEKVLKIALLIVAALVENTAVLWEGAYGWIGLGYPVVRGEATVLELDPVLSD